MYISVVIPALNAEAFIGIQLKALSKQRVDFDWEVIVVDNGSRDKTVDVVSNYSNSLPNLRVVQAHEHRSAAYARNVGAAIANGDFLAFCDADDVVEKDWLHFMGEALRFHPFVAGRLCSDDINEEWLLKVRKPVQESDLQQGTFLPHAATCNLAIHRFTFEAVGGFDMSMRSLEDTDFCWKVQLTGIKLHFEKQAVIHYRFRTSLFKLFNQFRLYGQYSILLHKRYQPLGKPRIGSKVKIQTWLDLLRGLKRLDSKHKLGIWIKDFGWNLGLLQGCIYFSCWS